MEVDGKGGSAEASSSEVLGGALGLKKGCGQGAGEGESARDTQKAEGEGVGGGGRPSGGRRPRDGRAAGSRPVALG